MKRRLNYAQHWYVHGFLSFVGLTLNAEDYHRVREGTPTRLSAHAWVGEFSYFLVSFWWFLVFCGLLSVVSCLHLMDFGLFWSWLNLAFFYSFLLRRNCINFLTHHSFDFISVTRMDKSKRT